MLLRVMTLPLQQGIFAKIITARDKSFLTSRKKLEIFEKCRIVLKNVKRGTLLDL